jgi:hypothetical protein
MIPSLLTEFNIIKSQQNFSSLIQCTVSDNPTLLQVFLLSNQRLICFLSHLLMLVATCISVKLILMLELWG